MCLVGLLEEGLAWSKAYNIINTEKNEVDTAL